MYVSTSLESPASRVVVPRWSCFCCFDLLISRCRLWPQLRLILPVAVRPKRFFAPLLVLSLGTFLSLLRGDGGPACPSCALTYPWGAACRRLKPRYITRRTHEGKARARSAGRALG